MSPGCLRLGWRLHHQLCNAFVATPVSLGIQATILHRPPTACGHVFLFAIKLLGTPAIHANLNREVINSAGLCGLLCHLPDLAAKTCEFKATSAFATLHKPLPDQTKSAMSYAIINAWIHLVKSQSTLRLFPASAKIAG